MYTWHAFADVRKFHSVFVQYRLLANVSFLSLSNAWLTRNILSTKSSRYIPIYRQLIPALFGKQGIMPLPIMNSMVQRVFESHVKHFGPQSMVNSCYIFLLLMNKILHQKYLIDNPELSMYGVDLPTFTIRKKKQTQVNIYHTLRVRMCFSSCIESVYLN